MNNVNFSHLCCLDLIENPIQRVLLHVITSDWDTCSFFRLFYNLPRKKWASLSQKFSSSSSSLHDFFFSWLAVWILWCVFSHCHKCIISRMPVVDTFINLTCQMKCFPNLFYLIIWETAQNSENLIIWEGRRFLNDILLILFLKNAVNFFFFKRFKQKLEAHWTNSLFMTFKVDLSYLLTKMVRA